MVEDQIRQINFQDSEQVIYFYESNLLYYENYQRLDNPEKISEFIDVKLHYANSLTDKHHLDKVLRILGEVSDLLDKLPKDHRNYGKSEKHVRFLKGMALAKQKKFKESYPIFKRLIKEDPEHYYYQVWYAHTKLGTYNWVFNGVAVLGGIFVFGDIIFSLSNDLPFNLGIIGFILLGLAYFTQKGLNRYFKNRPNKREA